MNLFHSWERVAAKDLMNVPRISGRERPWGCALCPERKNKELECCAIRIQKQASFKSIDTDQSPHGVVWRTPTTHRMWKGRTLRNLFNALRFRMGRQPPFIWDNELHQLELSCGWASTIAMTPFTRKLANSLQTLQLSLRPWMGTKVALLQTWVHDATADFASSFW